MPKIFEKLAILFPLLQTTLIVAVAFFLSQHLSVGLLSLIFIIYFLPVILWRLFAKFYPLSEGISYLGKKEALGNPWLVAHYLQYFFISFPVFERLLILIPGVFSQWLRLWGSQIGKGVIWNPGVQIVDRTHLCIGDYALFGDRVYLSTHIIKRKNSRIQLLVKKIVIGQKTLIGYQSNLGPGSVIPDGIVLPSLSQALLGRVGRSVHEITSF